MSAREPTAGEMWVASLGLLGFSLLIFIVVSIGVVCALAFWIVTLPVRLFSRGSR